MVFVLCLSYHAGMIPFKVTFKSTLQTSPFSRVFNYVSTTFELLLHLGCIVWLWFDGILLCERLGTVDSFLRLTPTRDKGSRATATGQ
eukprot:4823336-Amphidinium_carterae.1